MTRIKGPEIKTLDERLQRNFAKQEEQYGQLLDSQHIAAHCPPILDALRGMFGGLHKSGQLDPGLRNLLNRHVALINHCPF